MNTKVLGPILGAVIFAILGGYFVAFRPILHSFIIGGVFFLIALGLAFLAYRAMSQKIQGGQIVPPSKGLTRPN